MSGSVMMTALLRGAACRGIGRSAGAAASDLGTCNAKFGTWSALNLEVEDVLVEVVVLLVVDEVVEVGPVLHLPQLRGEVPVLDERIECTGCRAHRDPQQRHRPDDDVHPDVAQLVDRE